MTRKGGQDPTRHEPGGSRTETKIAEESELGSDGAGDAPCAGRSSPEPEIRRSPEDDGVPAPR
jgi:hypothetical protein